MSRYDTTLDPHASNTSHWQVIDLVPGGSDVLDVGCSTGYLAEALTQHGCAVSGIEYDADAAEKARPHLQHLVVGDLVTMDLAAELGDRTFDVIVCADILEHLPDPVDVLRRLLAHLRPGGSVVISVPNVAHGSLRLALLQGRWQYTPTGLLDSTHIRFFTRRSLTETLRDAGLVGVDVRRTTCDPLGAEVAVDAAALPDGVVDWVRAQPDADTYQFVLRAVRDDAEGAAARAARERAEIAAELEELRAQSARWRDERDAARAALGEVQATRAWRALALPRAAYGRLRTTWRKSR
jgi:2-polyprenyl-3-methyl-5-hydroxy-6-metoxy-1,4-benzoquinol methylase